MSCVWSQALRCKSVYSSSVCVCVDAYASVCVWHEGHFFPLKFYSPPFSTFFPSSNFCHVWKGVCQWLKGQDTQRWRSARAACRLAHCRQTVCLPVCDCLLQPFTRTITLFIQLTDNEAADLGPVYTACLLSAGEGDGSLCPDSQVNVWRRCVQAGVVGGGIVCAKRPSAFRVHQAELSLRTTFFFSPHPPSLSISLSLRDMGHGERHGGLIDPPPNDPAICEAVGRGRGANRAREKEGGTGGSNEYLSD